MLPLFNPVRASTWKQNAIKFFQNLFSLSRALSQRCLRGEPIAGRGVPAAVGPLARCSWRILMSAPPPGPGVRCAVFKGCVSHQPLTESLPPAPLASPPESPRVLPGYRKAFQSAVCRAPGRDPCPLDPAESAGKPEEGAGNLHRPFQRFEELLLTAPMSPESSTTLPKAVEPGLPLLCS